MFLTMQSHILNKVFVSMGDSWQEDACTSWSNLSVLRMILGKV